MSLLPKTAVKTFNLLSIGQRGVGKTVFLAGSYAELNASSKTTDTQKLWFDCQDSQTQENIEGILKYIARTGQYPPPTLKVTGFNFSLKHRSPWGIQIPYHFLWWDVPGETCKVRDPDFCKIVSTSHGCCVFIDAYALLHNPSYRQALENIIQQVMAIATLISLNHLEYAFALILTKCDLLEPNLLNQPCLEESLLPLTTYLDKVRVNYQTFRSNIPIVFTEGGSTLRTAGAAVPLLWLVCELDKIHNANPGKNLFKLGTRLTSGRFQPQQNLVGGLTQSLYTTPGWGSRVGKRLGLFKLHLEQLPVTHRYFLILIFIASAGIISSFFVDYRSVFRDQPDNLSVPSQAEPEHLKLRLQLAQSYEATGQVAEAEALYDEVLAKQKNNLRALVGKAVLRHAQGDSKMAEVLFVQAERAASTDLKGQVRAVAQKTLQTPNKSMPSAK